MPFTGSIVVATSDPTPDRATFGEMKAELARPFNPDDPVTVAIAGDAIVSALKAYARFNWPWDLLTVDITMTSGTDTYALPQPFKLPKACFYLDSASRPDERLAWVPYDAFTECYNIASTGKSQFYTARNVFETGQVTFYPVPSFNDSLRLWYYRMTSYRLKDDDAFDVPAYADEAIHQWAWYEMLKRIGGNANIARMPSARADAMASRAELVAMVANRSDPIGVI